MNDMGIKHYNNNNKRLDYKQKDNDFNNGIIITHDKYH